MYNLRSLAKNLDALLKEFRVDGPRKTKREVLTVLSTQPVVKEMQKSLNSLTIQQRVDLFQKGAGYPPKYAKNLIGLMCIAATRLAQHYGYARQQQMQRQPSRSPWNELGKGR